MKNQFARTGSGKPLNAYFIGTQEYKHRKLSPHLAVSGRKSLLQPIHVAQSPCRHSPLCAQLVPPWHKLCPYPEGHCVLLPHLPMIQTWLETAQWKSVLSLFISGWDRDVECGPISLSVHQYLVGPGDGEASCAKIKAGYKEEGKENMKNSKLFRKNPHNKNSLPEHAAVPHSPSDSP